MKLFEVPEIDVTKIAVEDVITTSDGSIPEGSGDPQPGSNGTVIG